MKEKKIRIRRKNAGYKKIFLLFIIIVILILLITKIIFPATISLSRYVYSVVKGAYLNSKEFYFTSNRLGKENNKYEVHNWDGLSGYTVNIDMYSRKNALKFSNMNIEYEVTVEAQVFMHQANGTQIEAEGSLLKLSKDQKKDENEYIIIDTGYDGLKRIIKATTNQDDFDIDITPKNNYKFNDDDYVELKITANSISPYTDTISGVYKVFVGKEGLSYKIENSKDSPYLNVILTNASSENEIRSIDLEFNPTYIVLDTTSNEYITAKESGKEEYLSTQQDESQYFNKIRVDVHSLESRFVKFYKVNEDNWPEDWNEEKIVKVIVDGNEI